FTCWYSNCDNIVFPTSTAQLQGADNRFVDGVAHVQMAFHPEVMKACLDEIARD
ncbi:MAG: permease, partial [Comamonadaceae bacterium]